MTYFSYNDFADCTENEDMYGIRKVEENIAKYEVKNGVLFEKKKENQIIKILKEKSKLKDFLRDFSDLYGVGNVDNISYCNNIKSISDRENNNMICRVKDKEIFICIKVIEEYDSNISYKMFENSLNIIENWELKERVQYKRHPIVIPIVIYTGQEKWRSFSNTKVYKKLNYITYEDNRINFSYNVIDINNLDICCLDSMKSEVAKVLRSLKNKYLQIN